MSEAGRPVGAEESWAEPTGPAGPRFACRCRANVFLAMGNCWLRNCRSCVARRR